MSYLDSLQKSLQGAQGRRRKTQGTLNDFLATLPPPQPPTPPAPAAPVVIGSNTHHHPNDGHDHSGGKGLDPNFNAAVQRMMKDAPGSIKINSGYRSVERQAQLWAEALKKYGSPERARKWVAPPGKSNHGRGIAMDLGYANPQVKAWVHANAKNYGLHFPLGHEPWHIEPIGSRKK
jgi:LAS superfamily LD-carboxypeptidase LdcB